MDFGRLSGEEFTELIDMDRFNGGPPSPPQKPFFIKVTPGTPLYDMMIDVRRSIPEATRQRCVRILAIAGYGVFRKTRWSGEQE